MRAGEAAGGYAVQQLVDTTNRNEYTALQATAVGAAGGGLAATAAGALTAGASGTAATFLARLWDGSSPAEAWATAAAEVPSMMAYGATTAAVAGAVSGARVGYRMAQAI